VSKTKTENIETQVRTIEIPKSLLRRIERVRTIQRTTKDQGLIRIIRIGLRQVEEELGLELEKQENEGM